MKITSISTAKGGISTPMTERPAWPAVDGEMARRIRDHEWEATPLGPIDGWPQSLRTATDIMLSAPRPAFIGWGPEITLLYNDACPAFLGRRHPAALGQPAPVILARFWDEIEPPLRETMKGHPQLFVDWPFQLAGRSGRPFGWFTLESTPVRDETGAVAGLLATITDTTEDVLARERLREGEARQAFLLALGDALAPLADPTEIQDVATRTLGERLRVDRALYVEFTGNGEASALIADRMYLRSDTPAIPGRYLVADYGTVIGEWAEGHTGVEPDVRQRVPAEAAALLALEIGAYISVPLVKESRLVACLIVHQRTPRNWTPAEVSLVEQVAERTWAALGHARAEEALRASERRMRMLLAELQHRVRNTLGIIKSIARRTAETSLTVEDYAAHLDGRIEAFARVQSALTRDPGRGVDLAGLVEDELLAHATREGDRLRLRGPATLLKARAAESISLAVHELATNAVKHGALSIPDGRIDVSWVSEDDALLFCWKEYGVEQLPARLDGHGFGMELLLRSLPYDIEAETDVAFEPGGLRFTLRAPASLLLAEGREPV